MQVSTGHEFGEIPCIFPAYQGIAPRDEFAPDSPHRHLTGRRRRVLLYRDSHRVFAGQPRKRVIPRGAEWGRWHHRLDARAVVSRHLNVPTTRYANDVRFEDASRGYPDEWTVRGKPRERQNCDLEAHFRDILPPTEKDVSEPLKGYEF